MRRPMNFNPGPATLPLEALERAREEFLDFAGTGISVMEHSHRHKAYETVHEEAMGLVRQLLGVPSDYEILFVQGGASTVFAVMPMNFLPSGGSADFVVTGAWSDKAHSEAALWAAMAGATTKVAASTKASGFGRVARPDEARLDERAAFVHFASNETIHGVQYLDLPRFGSAPHVCDMSSDILSRKFDVSRFAFIYGGAQKNIGPSGVTLVVARRDFVDGGRKDLPKILQYRSYVEARSLLNTPPTFSIYMMRNVLLWLDGLGGLEAIDRRNRTKAAVLYAAIDAHPGFYRCPVDAGSRSRMNVVFRLPGDDLEKKFLDEAKAQGMLGLKGHRSAGGIRASLYNAVEPAWVDELAKFMNDFVKRNG